MKLKLGKLAAKKDRRTIKMASLLKSVLPEIPKMYDVDTAHPGCDTPMFLNDQLGDCVIAGRAHMTRRFEMVETAELLKISDDEVRKQYFLESSGKDSGLVMLNSLKVWRKGWKVAGRSYSIYAFASVNPSHSDDVRACIYLLVGCYVGLALPLSAKDQLGKLWTVTNGPRSRKNSWGGHCVYLCGFDDIGPICITWGAKQKMTWAWFAKYCDEAYGIVDSVDPWIPKPGIDEKLLNTYLKEVTK